MAKSDHEIQRGVRGVLSRHWVDLSSTTFASRKGIVRVMGELRRVGPACGSALERTNLTALDSELRRLDGVKRVHFDVAGWRRNEDGEWVRVEREAPAPALPGRASAPSLGPPNPGTPKPA